MGSSPSASADRVRSTSSPLTAQPLQRRRLLLGAPRQSLTPHRSFDQVPSALGHGSYRNYRMIEMWVVDVQHRSNSTDGVDNAQSARTPTDRPKRPARPSSEQHNSSAFRRDPRSSPVSLDALTFEPAPPTRLPPRGRRTKLEKRICREVRQITLGRSGEPTPDRRVGQCEPSMQLPTSVLDVSSLAVGLGLRCREFWDEGGSCGGERPGAECT